MSASLNAKIKRPFASTEADVQAKLIPAELGFSEDTKRMIIKSSNGTDYLFYWDSSRLECFDNMCGHGPGASLIGVDGIAGITPTGGSVGVGSNLQAVLEGISTGVGTEFVHAFSIAPDTIIKSGTDSTSCVASLIAESIGGDSNHTNVTTIATDSDMCNLLKINTTGANAQYNGSAIALDMNSADKLIIESNVAAHLPTFYGADGTADITTVHNRIASLVPLEIYTTGSDPIIFGTNLTSSIIINNGDIYTLDWVDWSANAGMIAALIGWTGTPGLLRYHYKIVGKTMRLKVQIGGSAYSTVVRIPVPYALYRPSSSPEDVIKPCQVYDLADYQATSGIITAYDATTLNVFTSWKNDAWAGISNRRVNFDETFELA
jgi:hypothetical protein